MNRLRQYHICQILLSLTIIDLFYKLSICLLQGLIILVIIQIMADQLTQVLKQRIDFTRNTLYENLTIFDTIVKQLQINPTNPIALSAYELICRQYINPKTPSQSSKGPSSPQNSNSIDINDPEVMGHFSFAKKPKQFYHLPKEVKPQRLFYENKEEIENKSFSQKVKSKQNPPKNIKNYVSNFQLPLVDFDDENISKDDWKQRSRIKLQDVQNKQAEVNLLLKGKYFVQLMEMIGTEKKIIIKQLRIKSAIFMHQSLLLRKSWKILQEQLKIGKENKIKVEQIIKIKEESMIQEYFLAWRQRALMTEAERSYEAQINKGYEKLAKIKFLRNLSRHYKGIEERQNQLMQRQMYLISKIKEKNKKDLLQTLSQNLFKKNQLKNKGVRLNQVIKSKQAQICFKIIKKITVSEINRQQKLILKMQRYLYGFNLIKNIRQNFQIRKVYWKNPEKILFLKMIFEAISDSLSRQGYNHQWMRQLPFCLTNTDKKLNNFQQKYHLSRIFKSFKFYLQTEKEQTAEVRTILGRRVLKHLIGNYKIQMLKQKESCQIEHLSEIIDQNKKVFGLELFRNNIEGSGKRKRVMVEENLYENKIKSAFVYLSINRKANLYYSKKIQEFKQKIQRNMISKVFYGFKQITMTSIVNNRIVNQFNDYRNIMKLSAIFSCLKQYTIEQKIMRKRSVNLLKMRLSSYFGVLTFNMRVSMYGRYKARHQQLKSKEKKFRAQIQRKQCKLFFTLAKRDQLKKIICLKIDQEYNQRLKYKVFKVLQTVSRANRQQNGRIEQIRQKNNTILKEKVLNGLVNSFIKSLLLKNIAKITNRFLSKGFLDKLKNFSHQEEQFHQEKLIQNQQE